MKERKAFVKGKWNESIDVQNFIQLNYKPYDGDENFLSAKSEKTSRVWSKAEKMIEQEIEDGIYDIETKVFSGIDQFEAGYIDKADETVVGFQTDGPLKRIMNPYGGFRMLESSLEAYGREMPVEMSQSFQKYRKTHNQGVFDAYTKDMMTARSVGLLTGLPDAYGRGRIIGDYRRIPLYGINRLIEEKKSDFEKLEEEMASEDVIRLREEVTEQLRALEEIKRMALSYDVDISLPAESAQEAVQYFYFLDST